MERYENESWDVYKRRRAQFDRELTPKKRLLWDSAKRGTYIRKKHGNLH